MRFLVFLSFRLVGSLILFGQNAHRIQQSRFFFSSIRRWFCAGKRHQDKATFWRFWPYGRRWWKQSMRGVWKQSSRTGPSKTNLIINAVAQLHCPINIIFVSLVYVGNAAVTLTKLRAGQGYFELCALFRIPSCCGFFIAKWRQTNRTQHVTIVLSVNQFFFFCYYDSFKIFFVKLSHSCWLPSN